MAEKPVSSCRWGKVDYKKTAEDPLRTSVWTKLVRVESQCCPHRLSRWVFTTYIITGFLLVSSIRSNGSCLFLLPKGSNSGVEVYTPGEDLCWETMLCVLYLLQFMVWWVHWLKCWHSVFITLQGSDGWWKIFFYLNVYGTFIYIWHTEHCLLICFFIFFCMFLLYLLALHHFMMKVFRFEYIKLCLPASTRVKTAQIHYNTFIIVRVLSFSPFKQCSRVL